MKRQADLMRFAPKGRHQAPCLSFKRLPFGSLFCYANTLSSRSFHLLQSGISFVCNSKKAAL